MALFFSTSGGKTESNQFAFGSSPIAYLQSVKDPYDNISPYHTWTVHESQGEMESALSGLFSGRLKKVKVTKTRRLAEDRQGEGRRLEGKLQRQRRDAPGEPGPEEHLGQISPALGRSGLRSDVKGDG